VLLSEFFVKLGLSADWADFAKANLVVEGLAKALHGLGEIATSALDAMVGWNADMEASTLKLASIASLNLGLPWEQAKAAAGDFFKSLQDSVASTPATLKEMTDISAQVGGAFLKAGKSLDDLKQFIPGLTVAMKTFGHEAIAPLEVQEALMGIVTGRQVFSRMLIEQGLGMSREAFAAKTMKERADLLMQAVNSPTIKAARKEFESNWQGVTSTIRSNIAQVLGAVGEPLFQELKHHLANLSQWLMANKQRLVDAGLAVYRVFRLVVSVFESLYRIGKAAFDIVAGFVDWFLNSASAGQQLLVVIGALTAAVELLGGAAIAAGVAAAAPWLATAALLSFIYLLLDDIIVAIQGGRSVTGELYEAWSGFLEKWSSQINPEDNWLIATLKLAIWSVTHLQELWDEFTAHFRSDGPNIFQKLGENMFTGQTGSPFQQSGASWIPDADAMSKAYEARSMPMTVWAPPMAPPANVTNHHTTNLTLNIDNAQGPIDPHSIADVLERRMDDHFDARMREAAVGVK
jgi:hypothetical protein